MADRIPIKRALVSVFDKSMLDVLAPILVRFNVEVLSTGGTAKALRALNVNVVDVSDVTKWPEMLGGRVKTLHPVIHGGLLANRADPTHVEEMGKHDIKPIDMVISNLYPFEKTVESGKPFEDCIEMIDIGGPTMVRAAAKNCDSVAVVTGPSQYGDIIAEMEANEGALSKDTRRKLAATAFISTAKYDAAVSSYLTEQTGLPKLSSRFYSEARPLKYGVNPHQKPASLASIHGSEMPFEVVNGNPGYTNIMDALNAWQLVQELHEALGKPAAASFKHVSPAGAAVAEPLTPELAEAYEVSGKELTDQALAYIRARNADPMSSYGDFAAISGTVDVYTAEILKREVSDGVIAADYEPEALELLRSKKGGKYVVLKASGTYAAPQDEVKEVFGVALWQKRNDAKITVDMMKKTVTSANITDAAIRDLVVATITVKYTQSNSVCYAVGGQVVGVGAGQQSRVDCVKLAGRKVDVWHARLHPRVRSLPFKQGVKRPERVNARVAFIAGDMTPNEYQHWSQLFETVPEPLSKEERDEWQKQLNDVCLSSDAFFPFRDNIDQATRHGVKFIVQPGGSVQDDGVIEACDEYGIAMAFTGLRVFHH